MRNNLANDGNAIVGTDMIIRINNKEVGSISNATLSASVVLTRTPLPDLSIVNVSFAGRMLVAQESTRENRNRVLVVGNASEPATELGVDVVGEVLISDLHGKGVKLPRIQV